MFKNPISYLGLCLIATMAQAQHTYLELELADDGRLRYALVLPRDFNPEQTYPALLALPPGGQNEQMVEAGLSRYWGRQAADRGWLVVSPVAPQGVAFFQGSERYIPELLAHIRATYKVEGDHFHLAGNSNGGRSAFRIALDHPGDFVSLLALPGFPPEDDDLALLERLAGKPVRLFVGGEDRGWVERMQRTRDILAEMGNDVMLTVLPGEGHVPPSLDGGRFMDELTAIHAKLSKAPTASTTKGPVINSFGPVFPVNDPDFPTRVDTVHRAVFDVGAAPANDVVNSKIETLARFLNMHAQAGVESQKMKLALVLHGEAGRAALTNDAYRERHGVDNPDLPLLQALHESGAEIYLCGQTAAYRGFSKAELAKPVDLALSAMTVLVSLQSEGYALIAF